MDEPAPLRQSPPQAVEYEAGELEVIGALAGDQRGTFGEDEPGLPAHAHELRTCGQPEIADAVDARRERKRGARVRRGLDGALQGAALVVGTAGAQPELRAVEPEGRDRRRCSGTCRKNGAGTAIAST